MRKALLLSVREFVELNNELKELYPEFNEYRVEYFNHLFKIATYKTAKGLEKYIYDADGTQALFEWVDNNIPCNIGTIEKALMYSAQGYKICSHCHRPIKDNEKFYQDWGAIYCEECKDFCEVMDTTGD